MANETFITSRTVDDDLLIIKLHGNLDSTTTSDFDSAVQHHFDQGLRKIIIDCANLGYISSLGIGSLVSLQARLRKQGGEVKLAAIQGPVAEVLKLVHIDKLMEIYGDTQFARESFPSSNSG